MTTQNSQGSNQINFEKVQTIDGLLEIFYAVMAGENGEARDWDVLRYCCQPDAKMIRYEKDLQGIVRPQYLSIEDYINSIGKWIETKRETGFYELEIHKIVNEFGPIAHVWSTSESFHSMSDKEPYVRNIHSFQLVKHDDRWWIINLFWTRETPNNPIPKEYLPK